MSQAQDVPLSAANTELIAAARTIIRVRHRARWHEIGAALRTRGGRIFTAVHLEANVGRIAVCAESIALGMAVPAGDGTIETIVAVDADGDIVAPCGMCREMISDYAPAAGVLLPSGSHVNTVSISHLLPFRTLGDYLA